MDFLIMGAVLFLATLAGMAIGAVGVILKVR